MKTKSLVQISALLGAHLITAVAISAKPNIVVIVSDDQGYADVSYNPLSPPEVKTPNIDKLARSGIIFTNGYASGYVCSPTRAGLMTGRYQQRFGIYTAGQGGSGMPLDETWIPMHLKQGGYVSGAFGKWHLGLTEEYNAVNRGFDYFYGFMGRGAHDYFNHDPDSSEKFDGPLYRNLEVLRNEEGYLTNLITKEAVDFIHREKDNPFFAYVAYNAVHAPAQAPEEDIRKFNTGDPTRDILMAMLLHLDNGVGEIVQALKDTNVYQNTIVFYLSDNGGAGTMNANNAPLRGYKQMVYEGGIRVPFIVSWPGTLKSGQKNDTVVWSTDILPTILTVTGLPPLAGSKPLDGLDMWPVLIGDQTKLHEALYWCSGHEGKWAVRHGVWKYTFDRGEEGLFDLSKDIAEENNLMMLHPERLAQLKKLYAEWFVQMGNPVSDSKNYTPGKQNKNQ